MTFITFLCMSVCYWLTSPLMAEKINDFSRLNETEAHQIIAIQDEHDIRSALEHASRCNCPISMAGARHSQGGHAFYSNAIVLDMTRYNKIIDLDAQQKILTVQSGATWKQIQDYLHEHTLAVSAMQSSNIFTVGGSMSVNAHGMDHRAGSVANSIVSFRLMLADGTIKTVSPTLEPELFNLVLGGYGLFGVILDVRLRVVDNVLYDRDMSVISFEQFPEVYNKIDADSRYELFYGHFSTAPGNFLTDMAIYSYYRSSNQNQKIPALKSFDPYGIGRLMFAYLKISPFIMQRFKWFLESHVESLQKLTGFASVSRNQIMYDSVEYLQTNFTSSTDILHEYYIPREQFVEFINRLRPILQVHSAKLLNASVRIVHKENIVLNYAPDEMFALVLYFKQNMTSAAHKDMASLTRMLIELSMQVGGSFFLPYQLHYTTKDMARAYPRSDYFFEQKRVYDPKEILVNTFYKKYGCVS